MTSGLSSGTDVTTAPLLQRLRHSSDRYWLLLPLLAAALYCLGLDSFYAPTNGDEMVYIHLARMTSDSGHWLPLQSEIHGMRNTKPPLLIWQAMVAGGWGRFWHLWALRIPSVIYTLSTAFCGVGYFSYRLSGARLRTACVAIALYLLYFSSFRYGRVYLTSAPETFWLALPMWWLLDYRLRHPNLAVQIQPRHFCFFGIVLGLGAAYKSFALLAPAAAAWWLAALWGEPSLRWHTVRRLTVGMGASVLLGLAIFASWFLLDPDPQAVWQEFVVSENAGKMTSSLGYWYNALYGAYPLWPQLFSYPINAGLLAFQTLGFMAWSAYQIGWNRGLRNLSPAMRVLLVWLLLWLVVFCIPSQRSERYVIPAMPALAIAMALAWERIPRIWSLVCIGVCVPALVILARIAWFISTLKIATSGWAVAAAAIATFGVVGAVWALVRPRHLRNAGLFACLGLYACFYLMVTPLDGDKADFGLAIKQDLQGKRIAVPNGFTGQFEAYHFVFPGATIAPYDAEGRNTGERYPDMPATARLNRLLNEFDAVVWREENTPLPCLPNCRILDQRWHVRSRHKDGDVTLDNIWYPEQWLFNREWLLAPANTPGRN